MSMNLVENNISSGAADVRRLKRLIQGLLCPDNPLDFSGGAVGLAARAFENYEGSAREKIDLMLFYVECGTQFTRDHGDIDEDFYMAVETTFEDALKLIKSSDAAMLGLCADRLRAIHKAAEGVGWGYPEQIGDLIDMEFPEFRMR